MSSDILTSARVPVNRYTGVAFSYLTIKPRYDISVRTRRSWFSRSNTSEAQRFRGRGSRGVPDLGKNSLLTWISRVAGDDEPGGPVDYWTEARLMPTEPNNRIPLAKVPLALHRPRRTAQGGRDASSVTNANDVAQTAIKGEPSERMTMARCRQRRASILCENRRLERLPSPLDLFDVDGFFCTSEVAP